MGSWFSNFHIRKTAEATEESVRSYIVDFLGSQQFSQVLSEKDADGSVAVVTTESCPWISVYSDLLSFGEPEKYAEIAKPMSLQLRTDILGISCFDSDYLYLNLVNETDATDAWVGIGSASGLGIKRRSGLNAWKKKVSDFAAFADNAKKKYVFAEEFLSSVENSLGLPLTQSSGCYEYLKDLNLDQNAKYFYFKLPENVKHKEPVKLVPFMPSGMPCFLEKYSAVSCINAGGESKGLSVYFIGPYVEKDEITFSDVCFAKHKNNSMERTPITLMKVQLQDGQWAYYHHDPGFRIPAAADDRLPARSQMNAVFDRSITVGFIPHGNPRKILDITVVLVPDQNLSGQTGWNVWQQSGSKREYIHDFNEGWEFVRRFNPDSAPPLLREEDFD